jgi:hypothetical protein
MVRNLIGKKLDWSQQNTSLRFAGQVFKQFD